MGDFLALMPTAGDYYYTLLVRSRITYERYVGLCEAKGLTPKPDPDRAFTFKR
jgi:hypothetical protein